MLYFLSHIQLAIQQQALKKHMGFKQWLNEYLEGKMRTDKLIPDKKQCDHPRRIVLKTGGVGTHRCAECGAISQKGVWI